MKPWIIERLLENSTWRGIILLATALGAHFSPDQANAIIGAGLALAGLINIFINQSVSKEAVSVAIEKNNVETLGLPPVEPDQIPKATIVPEP